MKKSNSLVGSIKKDNTKETDSLKNVIQTKGKEKNKEHNIEIEEPKKRVSKSFYIEEDVQLNLDRYCSLIFLKQGKKLNASSIVNSLIKDFLKDKDLTF